MSCEAEKREYPRTLIDFVMEVLGLDPSGTEYRDRATMRDISGNGAKFFTRHGCKYFTGQEVVVTIEMPGTDLVKACMRGRGTVVRIDPVEAPPPKTEIDGAFVVVKMDCPFRMERHEQEKGIC